MESGNRIRIHHHEITIVPRYNETDQGGVVHHSVYPVYFEMGRTELLRANNVNYKDMEKAGVFFVIVELHIKYRQPAEYDSKLRLITTCTKVTGSRVEHTYRLERNCDGMLLVEGKSVLACVDSKGRLRRMPEFMYME